MQHQISLPEKHSKLLKKHADRLDVSKSEVIRRALELMEEIQAAKEQPK